MPVFYDTNVLLEIARDLSTTDKVRKLVNPRVEAEFTSIVCRAELRSLAMQNGWGIVKLRNLDRQLENLNIVNVDAALVDRYVDIDVFSRKNAQEHATPIKSSRKMGKNDLWIAATASLLAIQLITVDADFDHLSGTYLKLKRLDPVIFKAIK